MKNRKFSFIHLIVFFFLFVNMRGQNTVERYVFNSSGAINTVGTVELLSSIGEPVVGEDLSISIGFLQPSDSSSTTNIEKNEPVQSVLIFPNPAKDHIKISSSINISQVVVYDYLGQIIYSKKIDDKEANMQLINIVPGIYYFALYKEDGVLFKTIKLIKVND